MQLATQHGQRLHGRALDGIVLGFAGFTLLCHFAVAFELGLDHLILLAAACLISAILIGWKWRHRTLHQSREEDHKPPLPTLRSPETYSSSFFIFGLAGLGTGLHFLTESLIGYWICGIMACTIALIQTSKVHPVQHRSAPTRIQLGLLAALGGACAMAVAFSHHGDSDDAFYVNLSVWALDHPLSPLLPGDTLHGFEGIPMSLPVFKVLSYEIFQAVLARLSGYPAITVVHIWMPPVMAFLIPFAWARLAILLLPGRWIFVVTLVIALLFLLGDGHASYGDFGLLRLQQGKSVLLLVGLPLVASYGLQFGLKPNPKHFIQLAAVQIAAIGLSTSALWLAPTTALLAMSSAVPLRGNSLSKVTKDIGVGLVTCLYPVLIALSMRGDTLRAFSEAVHPLPSLEWTGTQFMNHSLNMVSGQPYAAGLLLFCSLAVLGVPGTTLFRRYAGFVTGAFLILFFNPALARLVANQITGVDTYFRIFWLLPLPLFIAAVFSAPAENMGEQNQFKHSWTHWAGAAIGVALLLWIPQTYTLAPSNGVRMGWPGPKPPIQEFKAAQRIAAHASEGDFVLAPTAVSRWLPLLQQHPAPLVVREMHLDRLHERLGPEELFRRRLLTNWVGGGAKPNGGSKILEGALAEYPLKAVLLSGPALQQPELRKTLLDSELQVDFRDPDYELWVRKAKRKPSPQSSKRDSHLE
ncbi:MAG: hypothetical protein CL917_15355 [Deltaproteobacteria bacterium]|nr:hypothetical protein [Deltaproteobacteria bacterium]